MLRLDFWNLTGRVRPGIRLRFLSDSKSFAFTTRSCVDESQYVFWLETQVTAVVVDSLFSEDPVLWRAIPHPPRKKIYIYAKKIF